MFDVGLSEIVVILVVALFVVGPERLPEVARSIGKFAGRVQRFVGAVKQDVDRSMKLEELRELENKVKAEAAAVETAVQQAGGDMAREMRQLEQPLAGDSSSGTKAS